MSTTIYDGMIAVDADPFTAARRIREVLEPRFFKAFLEIRASLHALPAGSTWADSGRFDDDRIIEPRRIDVDLHGKIMDLHRSTEWTFTTADIGYDVTLLPNGAGGEPLVLVFGEQARLYAQDLRGAGVTREYGYWDNSDRPEDVTAAQWKVRRQAWSGVFDASPAQVGLGFSCPGWVECAMEVLRDRGVA